MYSAGSSTNLPSLATRQTQNCTQRETSLHRAQRGIQERGHRGHVCTVGSRFKILQSLPSSLQCCPCLRLELFPGKIPFGRAAGMPSGALQVPQKKISHNPRAKPFCMRARKLHRWPTNKRIRGSVRSPGRERKTKRTKTHYSKPFMAPPWCTTTTHLLAVHLVQIPLQRPHGTRDRHIGLLEIWVRLFGRRLGPPLSCEGDAYHVAIPCPLKALGTGHC